MMIKSFLGLICGLFFYFLNLQTFAQQPVATINYAGDNQDYHTADIYRIPSSNVQACVIFLHGGGWHSGSRGAAIPWLDSLVLNNFVVVDANYRLSSDSVFPAQIHDVKALVRYLKRMAGQLRIDSNKIGVLGIEAGGHLAALLGASTGVGPLEGRHIGVRNGNSEVNAVMVINPATSFLRADTALQRNCNTFVPFNSQNSSASRFLGCIPNVCTTRANQADPIRYVNSNEMPFLIHHARNNCVFPASQSVLLHQALQQNNIDATLSIDEGKVDNDPYYFTPAFKSIITQFFLNKLFRASVPSNCLNDSTGFIPLIDLGSNSFLRYTGGLYGNGNNNPPSGHLEAALNKISSIQTLDTSGVQDPNGKIGFVSIGMSNTNQEFDTFIQSARSLSYINPALVIANGAQGGMDIERKLDVDNVYWNNLGQIVRSAGISLKQVQVVWLKTAKRLPTNDTAHIEELHEKLIQLVKKAQLYMPNLKAIYLSSRIYGGYNLPNLGNPEPYAYYNGFSVQQLILSQITGREQRLFYNSTPVLLWGPYIWADGKNLNSDSLNWLCPVDFVSDGVHPSLIGRQKVTKRLIRFFSTDTTTKQWFLRSFPSALEDLKIEKGLKFWPNPAIDKLSFSVPDIFIGGSYELIDVLGRKIQSGVVSSSENTILLPVNMGIFHFRLTNGPFSVSKKIIGGKDHPK